MSLVAGNSSAAGAAARAAALAARATALAKAALRETERGAYAAALQLYAEAATLQPDDSQLLYNYAALARITGDLGLAERLLNRVVAINPQDSGAWLMLSGLRRWHADDNHVAALLAVLADAGTAASRPSPKRRVELLYALSKEYEDLEDYRNARKYLYEGAALRRRHINYNIDDDLDTISALHELVDALDSSDDLVASHDVDAPDHGPVPLSGVDTTDGPVPIFIVSLPRAGSTLLERMLSCDSRVTAAGELPFFPQLVGRALQQLFVTKHGPRARPQSKAELVAYAANIDWPALGRDYIKQLRQHGFADSPYVIDKMPMNYLNIGFIRRALPQARIIYLQRDPDDHALALLKHLFNEAYPWSYNTQEIERYTQAVRSLCSSACAQPGNNILPLHYEQLVQQPQRNLRQVANYCGLNWDNSMLERALNFDRSNTNASTTGSASQVRHQLHSRSIGLSVQFKD